MSVALADRLQIWGFQDDFVVFSDGSLGFSLKLTGRDFGALSDESINEVSQRLSSFLNSLEEELYVQFVFSVTGNNTEVLEKYKALANNANSNVAKNITYRRCENLSGDSQKGLIPSFELEAFVRRNFSKEIFEKPSFFKKQKLFEAKAEDRFAEEIKLTELLRDSFIREFSGIGIRATAVNSDTLFKKIYWQWNPTREIEKSDYDPFHVRENLLFTDALVYEDGFSLGTVHHKIVSLKLIPEKVFSGMSQALLALPSGAKLFLSIHIPNQANELRSLQTQRRMAYSMSEGKKGVRDIESEAKLSDADQLLGELNSQEEKVFSMSLQVILASHDQGDLSLMTRETLLSLRGLNGAEGMTESLASFDIFSDICIPNARPQERLRKMKTSYLTEFLPFANIWPGHEKPQILLKTTHGTLLSLDRYSPTLRNFNQIICGGSGAGKSFVATNLIAQLQKENPKTFVVDVGGSYSKLCSILDGQYILLTLNSGIAINPFDLGPQEITPSPDQIKFLLSLVEKMTVEDGQKRISRIERALIEEAIQTVYQKDDTPRLTHLRNILAEHSDVEMRRIAKILSPWCGETPFGSIVDRPTNVSLNKSFVCFDFIGLSSVKDLQSVSIHLVSNFIDLQVQRSDISISKDLIFDEVWELIADDAGAALVEGLARKARKKKAGLTAISQNIDDFAKSKVAQALLPNCQTKWILNQGDADQERLREVLQLNPNESQLVKNLTQIKGQFSQAFLMSGENRAVVSIEPTAYEYWVATTDPDDTAAFNEEIAKSPTEDIASIIEKLSQKYPRGVAAHRLGAL